MVGLVFANTIFHKRAMLLIFFAKRKESVLEISQASKIRVLHPHSPGHYVPDVVGNSYKELNSHIAVRIFIIAIQYKTLKASSIHFEK